jgi:hypothetical protein
MVDYLKAARAEIRLEASNKIDDGLILLECHQDTNRSGSEA